MKFVKVILNAKFLLSEGAGKNWVMLFFLAFLAIIMIASSHNVEYKVHKIAALNKQVQQLRAIFTEQRTYLMHQKMEATLLEQLRPQGIMRPISPIHKLVVPCKQIYSE